MLSCNSDYEEAGGMAEPTLGDTKIVNGKLLRYNGTAWEVITVPPPVPTGPGPLREQEGTVSEKDHSGESG